MLTFLVSKLFDLFILVVASAAQLLLSIVSLGLKGYDAVGERKEKRSRSAKATSGDHTEAV